MRKKFLLLRRTALCAVLLLSLILTQAYPIAAAAQAAYMYVTDTSVSAIAHTDAEEDGDTEETDAGSEEVQESSPLTMEDLNSIHFSDVPDTDPASGCIRYVACRGLLKGVGGGRFSPETPVTRATLMTVLSRASDVEVKSSAASFSDVSPDSWCANAVTWAVASGIARGNDDGTFAPNAYVTRADLAVFLCRYAKWLGRGAGSPGNTSIYISSETLPKYAEEAMSWALSNHLYDGMTGGLLPQLPVSRAQLAEVLTSFQALAANDHLAKELAAGLSTAPTTVTGSKAAHAEIQKVVDSVASKYGAVGLQAAVIEDGKVTDTYTYGWAVRDSIPMTDEHKIRVASITKVAVGISAMLLQEDGVISLDDDIGPYWGARFRNPNYPDVPITFRSILSHTSSIRVLDDSSRDRTAMQAKLSSAGGYSDLYPGSIQSWRYNNYAFSVLGTTLELASGWSLDDIMEESIWSPLDMDASFESGNVRAADKLAALYYQDGSLSRSQKMQKEILPTDEPGITGKHFAGGLTVSARDLAKMVALLANDGCYEGVRLLEAESVKTMETCNDHCTPEGFYQGLPLRYQPNIYGRSGLYYHTGSAYGVYNCMSYDPATRDGVVVLSVGASSTKDSHGIYAVCGDISQYIYDTIKE